MKSVRPLIILTAMTTLLLSSCQSEAEKAQGPTAETPQRTKAEGEHYTGDIYMTLVSQTDKAATYHQELSPGAHNDWHIHPESEQTMFILEGTALYQAEGQPIQVLRQGDFVSIAPNLKHWNGAAANEGCTLVTVTEKSEKGHIEWFDKVEESSILPVVVDADKMLIRISEIEVYPQYLEEYLEAAKHVGATSVSVEPGVICIYPMIQKRDKCQVRILEIYRDQEAYQQHIQSEHFQTYKQGTLHMVKSLDLVDTTPLDPNAMSKIFIKLNP